MIAPDKNNVRVFRVMVIVFLAVLAFAAWLVITSTVPLNPLK